MRFNASTGVMSLGNEGEKKKCIVDFDFHPYVYGVIFAGLHARFFFGFFFHINKIIDTISISDPSVPVRFRSEIKWHSERFI